MFKARRNNSAKFGTSRTCRAPGGSRQPSSRKPRKENGGNKHDATTAGGGNSSFSLRQSSFRQNRGRRVSTPTAAKPQNTNGQKTCRDSKLPPKGGFPRCPAKLGDINATSAQEKIDDCTGCSRKRDCRAVECPHCGFENTLQGWQNMKTKTLSGRSTWSSCSWGPYGRQAPPRRTTAAREIGGHVPRGSIRTMNSSRFAGRQ